MPDLLVDVLPPAWRPFTLRLDTDNYFQNAIYEAFASGSAYEPGTFMAFTELLRLGDVMVDAGAYVGVFTCLAASLVGIEGHVYAFEPDEANRERLIENVVRNGFADRVTIVPRALSDRNGPVAFFKNPFNDGEHALWNPMREAPGATTVIAPIEVESATLDSYLGTFEPRRHIRLIKADIEGAEVALLRGAEEVIFVDRPAIITEINKIALRNMGESELSLRTQMRAHGYRELGIQDAPPFYVELTPELTLQQEVPMEGGVLGLPVFNMLFLPQP